jgi:hypothetical protein
MLPAQGVLKQFAAHINGHDDEQSMALLARKYLALHVRVVPTNTAYTYIAGDYDLLTLRVRDPPISVYSSETSPIDVAAVVDIFKRGYLVKQNEKNKTLSAFVASTVSGAQPWKDAAYLYALNVRGSPQFHDLVQTIHREVPVSGRLFSDVYNQVKKYTLPKNEQTAKDMGMLIASLTYPEPVIDDFDTPTPIATTTTTTTKPKERALSVKASEATHELATMRAELEPFRKREMISPLRDTLFIAKQFLLSPAASRLESEVPLVAKLLRCSEFCAPLAAALVDAKASSSKVRALVEASNRYEWDSASLVERIISPTTTLDARVLKRYQAANVEEDDDVIARCIESCI